MTDYDLQQQLIAQRRNQYAGQREFRAPQGQMVGRHYVAPNALQYLAEGLRSFGGMRGQELAEKELQELGKQRTAATAEALRTFNERARGAPEQRTAFEAPAFDEADAAFMGQQGMQTVTPAVAPDMPGAFAALLNAPDAGLRQAGMQGMVQAPQLEAQAQERIAERDFRREQAELQNRQRLEQLQMQHEARMEMMREQRASQAEMAEANRQHQRQMAELTASLRNFQPPSAYYQPVQTAQGVMSFNARTGQLEIPTVNGAPVVGAAADPALQAQITGAETTARRQAESTAEARGDARRADMFLSQLSQAEQILKEGPTASGVGAARDAALRFAGIDSESANRAGQLEALSGWLVANVPRMEGPQSNFDVQNYMTMAGKIGDRTVPVPERLAALQEVRKLQEKYRDVAQERVQTAPNFTPRQNDLSPRPQNLPAGTQPTQRPVLRFDAQGNLIQ